MEVGQMIDLNVFAGDPVSEETLEVPLAGQILLDCPLLNKGTAFTERERLEFGLVGLLPPHVDSLEEQVARAYEEYERKDTDLERHIFLRHLQDLNETLYYRLLHEHIGELMPMIYTPVVGAACQYYSHMFREPRGLFISVAEQDEIETVLDNRPYRQVDVIVVTDGERILGLGDQGVGGMCIPVGKLSLYTLCGGVHPSRTLPVLLDVGTDNSGLLNDPLYAGSRHQRVRGQAYDDFIERFVQALLKKLPNVLLQWEDFAGANAKRLLERYRDRLCTFNDDIQGTAAVATGTLLAAVRAVGSELRQQQVVIVGAGSAGCGISELLFAAMVEEGLPHEEAYARLWLVDQFGLLHDGLPGLQPTQRSFAQPRERVRGWQLASEGAIGLKDVVRNACPTILIGVTGRAGLFTEDIIRELASRVPRPIVFPLSNPTQQSEATPADLITWSEGRAIVATGSPFADVLYQGQRFRIAQCNNSYVFPGVGLGILAARASSVSAEMFMAAARALAECSPARADPDAPLLPPLESIRPASRRIALAVAAEARRQGLARCSPSEEIEQLVDRQRWEPQYRPIRRAP
jgi:malate dehydrogenase (oxaloacetate-decarboxylating)